MNTPELPTPIDLAYQLLKDYTAPQLEEFLQALGEAYWDKGNETIKSHADYAESMQETAQNIWDAKAAWAARPILGTVRTA